MTVSDSVGEGKYVDYDTSSTTSAINTGRIVELNSDGDVILPTTTPGNPVGVSATKVSARTTASKEKITVQVSGMAHVACAANEAFDYNGQVVPAENGLAATVGTYAGTTFSSENMRKIIGRVYTPDATTTGTTAIVLLNIK